MIQAELSRVRTLVISTSKASSVISASLLMAVYWRILGLCHISSVHSQLTLYDHTYLSDRSVISNIYFEL